MKKLLKFTPVFSILALAPFVVYAQGAPLSATDVLGRISSFFSALLPLLISLGVLYFIWGVVQYFIGNTEEAKKGGRDRIIYGIIGLAVIVSLWGLVAILNKTLGLGGATGLVGEGAPTSITNLAPAAGSSCTSPNSASKFPAVIDYITCVIGQSVIPLIFALAMVMFIWGAVKFFIIDSGEEAKREQGKQFMIWGIIALAVMISVWGLVGVLGATFGLKTGFLPKVCPPGQSC